MALLDGHPLSSMPSLISNIHGNINADWQSALVIHFTLSDAAESEIPLLLQGQAPEQPSSSLGSGQWAERPKALVLGGAIQDSEIEAIQKAVSAASGISQIPWLRVDASKPAPPMGPGYATHIVGRLKEQLAKLDAEGKLGEGNAGIVFF
jgi:hypothetical protein